MTKDATPEMKRRQVRDTSLLVARAVKRVLKYHSSEHRFDTLQAIERLAQAVRELEVER